MPDLSATIVLCDAVQHVSGKLYILGGAWSRIIASPSHPSSIGIAINIRGEISDGSHPFELTLDREDKPYAIEGQPVRIDGTFFAGSIQGSRVKPDCNFCVQLALKLEVGLYRWNLSVDGEHVGEQAFEAIAGGL